jgi:hypothetical protein
MAYEARERHNVMYFLCLGYSTKRVLDFPTSRGAAVTGPPAR